MPSGNRDSTQERIAGRMVGMAEGWGKWFERLVRVEAAIALAHYLSGGIGVALGAGVVTATITTIQGALIQYGFAGFVIVALIVAILVLILIRLVRDHKDYANRNKNTLITLDAAAEILRSSYPLDDILESSKKIIQLAVDGSITLYGCRIHRFTDDIEYFDCGPQIKIDGEYIKGASLGNIDETYKLERRVYGAIILTGSDGISYNRLRVNINELIPCL